LRQRWQLQQRAAGASDGSDKPSLHQRGDSKGAPLLALPNLVELRAGQAEVVHLASLSRLSTLRLLDVTLHVREHREQAEALEMLTQLTALAVLAQEPDDVQDAEWLEHVVDVEEVTLEAAADWARTLCTLTGLCLLYVEPLVLLEMDLTALTALTCLAVDCKFSKRWHIQKHMEALLTGLAPMRGQLQEVRVLCVPSELEEVCEAAVGAALGDVDVEFE
jgi:hypothetical protein